LLILALAVASLAYCAFIWADSSCMGVMLGMGIYLQRLKLSVA
jgi:hypothetical protein